MNEIASMKKQQDSIMVVLENLEKKLRNQEQFLRNDKNRVGKLDHKGYMF